MISLLIAALLLPTSETEFAVHNRQYKFGSIEYDGVVGAIESRVEWYGLSANLEWVYDQHGGRELTVGPGYEHKFFDLVSVGVEYLYEGHPERIEDPTQFVVPEIRFDCLLSPSVEWWLDTDRNRGASYLTIDCNHEFDLPLGLGLELSAGVGIGNARRNEADCEHGSFGVKDLHASAGLGVSPVDGVRLVPYVGLIHRFFHGDDGGSDCVLCAGACVEVSF